MQSNFVRGRGEMMDHRRGKKDVRASNFRPSFDSSSKNMDGFDSSMVLEVPDTPERMAMRHSVGGSLKPSWGRNHFRREAERNYDSSHKYVTRSQSICHNWIESSSASDATEFFFQEANLARQLPIAGDSKLSSQCHSNLPEVGHSKNFSRSVRCGETIDLSDESRSTSSSTANCDVFGQDYVRSFIDDRDILSPPAEDEKMAKVRGNTPELKFIDKGKGIDRYSNLKLKKDCATVSNVERTSTSDEAACQNISNFVNGVMCSSSAATGDLDNVNGADFCRGSELVGGRPHQRRSVQRRLVRNGCISPLNIERSRNLVMQKEAKVGNNVSSSQEVHIISPDSQDRHSSKLKGKATVQDIVASSEQSPKDRSCLNSPLPGKEVAAISEMGGGGRWCEDKGWVTTRNHRRVSSTSPTWMSGSALNDEDFLSHPFNESREVPVEGSSSGVIHVDPNAQTPFQHGTDAILLQDSEESQSERGRVNGKRKLGSSHLNFDEFSTSNSVAYERLNHGRQSLNSRSTRSRRFQRAGLTLGPVIEVDELLSPEAVSHSSSRQDIQVESDELLARQLQEEFYNEPAEVTNSHEIDASIALLLQETDGFGASVARQRQPYRRDLSSSSTRSQFRQTRETTRSRVPTRSAQLRNLQRTIMDLNRRLGIREDAFSTVGDAATNSILHIQRDFNENDYEMLLALDENNQHGGASESQINNLPLSTIQNVDNQETCAVCLEPPAVGDTIRHLPCLHKFHKECIDMWLRRKRACPICKSDIR